MKCLKVASVDRGTVVKVPSTNKVPEKKKNINSKIEGTYIINFYKSMIVLVIVLAKWYRHLFSQSNHTKY